MRRILVLSLILTVAAACFSGTPFTGAHFTGANCFAQTQKKNQTQNNKGDQNKRKRKFLGSRRNRSFQYHPRILALFKLPGNLKADEKQIEDLKKLLKEFGPKMQVILPYLVAGERFNRESNWAKQGSVLDQRARRNTIRLRNYGKENQIKALKKQITEAKKEAKKIESDLKREIAELLTDEQKKSLRDMKAKASTKKAKKN